MANKLENKYHWNEKLQFTYGHVLMIVALIGLAYLDGMGAYYYTGGDFAKVCIFVGAILLVNGALFSLLQAAKAVTRRFGVWIVWERVLLVACVAACAFSMIPANHFFNLIDKDDEIEKQFSQSVSGSKGMFDDYAAYSQQRLADYGQLLAEQMAQGRITSAQRDSYVETLRLQLLSQNTDSLRLLALKWIDDANSGATVWNAFLIGNVEQIKSAIDGWHSTLMEYSGEALSNEGEPASFQLSDDSYDRSMKGLDQLGQMCQAAGGLNYKTVVAGIAILLFLLFPYLLQPRNNKAKGFYGFFKSGQGNRKRQGSDGGSDEIEIIGID